MIKILGFAGRRQSGKSSAANWIFGQQMAALEIVSYIKIDEDGRLIVPTVVNDELVEGAMDPMSQDENVQRFFQEYIWPVVKVYSFADVLKQSIHNIFGIPYENLYGSDAQKSAETEYTYSQWLPFMKENKIKKEVRKTPYKKISTRQILQIFGTNICRKIYGKVWSDATIRQINKDKTELAIICDVRFPDEAEAIHAVGGKIIHLSRAPFKSDTEHESETALDKYDGFDARIDNQNLTIEEKNEEINKILEGWGYNTWSWKNATED